MPCPQSVLGSRVAPLRWPRMRASWVGWLVGLALASTSAQAQVSAESQGPELLGERWVLDSTIMGEPRSIVVHVPVAPNPKDNPYQPAGPYPVVFLLDGESNLRHTLGSLEVLQRISAAPPMIVVAIENRDRSFDMTPVPEGESAMRSGGADRFLDFMERELTTFLEERYPVSSHRILIGHSLGGLFAVYALHSRPSLFRSYISISPSLWWDDVNQPDFLEEYFSDDLEIPDTAFYMSLADEGIAQGDASPMRRGVRLSGEVFEELSPENFRWRLQYFDDEDHITTVLRSTYEGFRLIFDGWSQYQTFLDEKDLYAMKTHVASLTESMGFPVHPPGAELARWGKQLVDSGQNARGLEIFEYLSGFFPQSLYVSNHLGQGLEGAKRYKEAEKAYLHSQKLAKASESPMADWVQGRLAEVTKKLQRGKAGD